MCETRTDGAVTMTSEVYESFLVRIWRKQGTNAQEGQWHGEIEQIQNGLRWAFHTLPDLLAFLQQAAGAHEPATPPNTIPPATRKSDAASV